MMNLTELRISYHFQNDRQGRKERIDSIVKGNWGQVIREEYYKGAWRCLTDNGLIFIIEDTKSMIMTYYFAVPEVVRGMYHGKAIPQFLQNKIKKNARTYMDIYNEQIRPPKW